MKKIMLKILSILSCLILIFASSSQLILNANESDCITEENYTSVLDDLEALNYDYNNINKTFITLIQTFDLNNNLKTFLYLNYDEPSGDNSEIVVWISTLISDLHNSNDMYYANLVSECKNNNLKKYDILKLDNLNDEIRYYKINLILSKSNETIVNYNDINKMFYFKGNNNEELEGYYKENEFVEITEKVVVNYCYGDSLDFFGKETGLMAYDNNYNDTWFVFFNTDKVIDNLMEIDISYQQYDYCIGATGNSNRMEFIITEDYVNDFIANPGTAYSGSAYDGDFYINYHDTVVKTIEPGSKLVESTQYGWFGSYKKTYEELDNIMDLRKYQAEDDNAFIFTDYADTYTWGVHFNDTTRVFTQKGINAAAGLVTGSGVTNTLILRLKFETAGKVYNLKADDTPTGSDENKGDIAETPKEDDLTFLESIFGNNFLKGFDEFKEILKIITTVILIIIVIWLISLFIKILKKIIKNLKG